MVWLTQRLFDSSAVRSVERRAIDGGIAADELMSRAATAALRVLRWPRGTVPDLLPEIRAALLHLATHA